VSRILIAEDEARISSFVEKGLVAAGFAVGIAPRSHIERARGWGVAMRPLANGPYLIGTQLLRKPHGSAPAVERFAELAEKVAATQAA